MPARPVKSLFRYLAPKSLGKYLMANCRPKYFL